jgi:hypothetical protein
MKKLSAILPFESTKTEVSEAKKKLLYEIRKNCLGRAPAKGDEAKFVERINPNNPSIIDEYFQGAKIGSIVTTHKLDGQRHIKLEFIPG